MTDLTGWMATSYPFLVGALFVLAAWNPASPLTHTVGGAVLVIALFAVVSFAHGFVWGEQQEDPDFLYRAEVSETPEEDPREDEQ